MGLSEVVEEGVALEATDGALGAVVNKVKCRHVNLRWPLAGAL
jgi:hypothetical protein